MNGILKKIILTIVFLPLAWEGIRWAAFRAPTNPPLKLTLKHQIKGFKPEVDFIMDKDLGIRTVNWSSDQKPAGAVRILCVGGEGTLSQFQTTADAWWGKLHASLEKKFPNRRLELAANAVPLTTSLRAAKWTKDVVPRLKPDLILTSLGADDIFNQPLKFEYLPDKIDKLPTQLPSRSAVRSFFLQYSQTARGMRASNIQREGLVISREFEDRDMATIFAKKQAEYARLRPINGGFRRPDNDPKTEYVDALTSLHATAKAAGAKLILTGSPMLVYREMEIMDEHAPKLLSRLSLLTENGNQGNRVETTWYASEYRRFQEAAQEFANKFGIPFSDLNGKIPRTVDNFVDELMLSDTGAALMAEQMEAVVSPVVAELMK